jgi:transposase
MLSPAKPRRLEATVTVSLEGLVPRDHFYRHLEAKLDLSFVREWTRGLYADRGRPSIDPVVFFKLQLVMFFEGIRSERKLVEMASLTLARRWYLGYALDEDLPDHSSLTRIRQRLGVDLFQRFFEKIVDLCQEARLVWGRELYFDGTKVEANADFDSLVPRFYYEAKTHLDDLFADAAPTVDPPPAGPELPAAFVRLPVEPSTNGPASSISRLMRGSNSARTAASITARSSSILKAPPSSSLLTAMQTRAGDAVSSPATNGCGTTVGCYGVNFAPCPLGIAPAEPLLVGV